MLLHNVAAYELDDATTSHQFYSASTSSVCTGVKWSSGRIGHVTERLLLDAQPVHHLLASMSRLLKPTQFPVANGTGCH